MLIWITTLYKKGLITVNSDEVMLNEEDYNIWILIIYLIIIQENIHECN